MAGHDKLTPAGKKFYAQVKKLGGSEVFIGYQAGNKMHKPKTAEGKEVDMTDIAMFNELGTSRSPARPFLRQTVEDNKDKINQMVEIQTRRLAKGADAQTVLKQLGAFGVSLVQEKIVSGTFTPNHPATIKAKGSERPLIDTGQMRQSVHYVIKAKGE